MPDQGTVASALRQGSCQAGSSMVHSSTRRLHPVLGRLPARASSAKLPFIVTLARALRLLGSTGLLRLPLPCRCSSVSSDSSSPPPAWTLHQSAGPARATGLSRQPYRQARGGSPECLDALAKDQSAAQLGRRPPWAKLAAAESSAHCKRPAPSEELASSSTSGTSEPESASAGPSGAPSA